MSTTPQTNFRKLVTHQALSILFSTYILVLVPRFLFPVLLTFRAAKGTTSTENSHPTAPNTSPPRVTQVSRKYESDVSIFLEFLTQISNMYTSVLDFFKLGIYPTIFLYGERSLQTKRYLRLLFKE